MRACIHAGSLFLPVAAVVRGFKEHWERVKESKEVEAAFTKSDSRADLERQPQKPQGKDPR